MSYILCQILYSNNNIEEKYINKKKLFLNINLFYINN